MSSDGWSEARLGDFIEVRHGFAFKTKYANGEPAPYALFTRKNFALGGGFREDEPRYYGGPFEARFVLEPGDLMVVLTDLSKNGDVLGLPAIVPRTGEVRYLHNQRVGKVLVKRPGLDRRFLYSLLRSPSYRRHVLSTASQTTVRDTAPSRLHDYTFRLPSLDEQRRIGEVLGALDDKIDSNRRLTGLLEETAATLFRARFVDFVGVEEFEDSELGPIPRGWRSGELGEIGAVHRQPVRGPSDLPYIGLDSMPRNSTVLAEWLSDGAPQGQACAFDVGDILFGKLRPYFHKVGVAAIRGRCSTEILVVRPRHPAVFGVLLSHVASSAFIDYCVSVSRGTRMPRAEWTDAQRFAIAIPPIEVAAEFARTSRTLYAQVRSCVHESITLASIRDALLPKLISGDIRVPDSSDVAEVIEPVVA